MSVTKEIRQCKPCLSNKTIQLIKNIWTSSKYQLPPARIFHYTGKCTLNGFRMGISRPISLIFLEKKFHNFFLTCYEGCTLGYSTGNFFLNSFQCCPVYLFFLLVFPRNSKSMIPTSTERSSCSIPISSCLGLNKYFSYPWSASK